MFIKKNLKNSILPQNILLSGVFLIFISFITELHAIGSLSIIVLLLFSLFYIKDNYHRFDVFDLLLILYYVLTAISYFWTENKETYFNQMRIKTSFLAFPFIFIYFRDIVPSIIAKLTFLLVLLTYISIIYTFYTLDIGYNQLILLFQKGQRFPMPFDYHNIYSIFILMTMLLILTQLKKSKFKVFYLISLVFFSIFIHIIMVRVGILIFYISTLVLSFYYIYKSKSLKLTLIISLCFIITISALYKSEYFYSKIAYMKYQFEILEHNDIADYNDKLRLASITNSFSMIVQNPLIGVGEGDVYNETKKINSINYPNSKFVLPHNQFLRNYVSSGVLLFICTIAIFGSLVYDVVKSKNIYLLLYTISVFISSVVDSNFEVQFGIVVCILPLYIIKFMD